MVPLMVPRDFRLEEVRVGSRPRVVPVHVEASTSDPDLIVCPPRAPPIFPENDQGQVEREVPDVTFQDAP
jgi:hypothetical protein